MEADKIPEWFDALKWIFAAALLGAAAVGPKILGPWIERMKASAIPQVHIGNPGVDTRQMMVVGSVLADKDAILQLTAVLERLTDAIEDRIDKDNERDKERAEEERTRRMIQELMRTMRDNEAHQK